MITNEELRQQIKWNAEKVRRVHVRAMQRLNTTLGRYTQKITRGTSLVAHMRN